MANWTVGDLENWMAEEEEKRGWSRAVVSWTQSSAFQEWPKVSALGLFGWPPSSFHQRSWHQLIPWLRFSLARPCVSWAEDTSLLFLTIDGLSGACCWLLSCAFLVLQIQHHSVWWLISHFVSVRSCLTCHVFKGAVSENQSECIHCRQVEVEGKPDKGGGKLCVMIILVRVGLKQGREKDKTKPQQAKTNKNL